MNLNWIKADGSMEALLWLVLAAIWFIAQVVGKINQSKRRQAGPGQPAKPGEPVKRPSGMDQELRRFLEQLSGQVVDEEEEEEEVIAVPVAPPPPPLRKPVVPAPVPALREPVRPPPPPVAPRAPARQALPVTAGVFRPTDLYILPPDLATMALVGAKTSTTISRFLSMGTARATRSVKLSTLNLGVMRPSVHTGSAPQPVLNNRQALKQALRLRFILDAPRAMGEHADPSR